MALESEFIEISLELDDAGLVWHPEIGDEVIDRDSFGKVSILVDPQGLSLNELRETFLWLPTVEQLVEQFEARQAVLFHAGITSQFDYEAVLRTNIGLIETKAETLRVALAKALNMLLSDSTPAHIH